MKITPEGWEYRGECVLVKDNDGTIPVHKDDIVNEHYELYDRYVADYCLYTLYRPIGIELKEHRKSLFSIVFERWIDKGSGYDATPRGYIDIRDINK